MIKLTLPIDMPNSCYDCPFDYDNIGCMAIVDYDEGSFDRLDDLFFDENTDRLPNCPLEEVPEESDCGVKYHGVSLSEIVGT